MSETPVKQVKLTRPAVVGALRGAIEAAAIAALGVAFSFVEVVEAPGEWKLVIPMVVLGVRTVEGLVDQRVDPSVQRGRLGGGPAV